MMTSMNTGKAFENNPTPFNDNNSQQTSNGGKLFQPGR